MLTRSLILTLVVCCFSAGCVAEDGLAAGEGLAEDSTGTVEQESKSSWSCGNLPPNVKCVGYVSIFAIELLVNNVRILNHSELTILERSLNDLSVTLKDVLDVNVILKNIEISVLNNFLNRFKIDIDLEDINVCAVGVACK